jgi:hypothetical protein
MLSIAMLAPRFSLSLFQILAVVALVGLALLLGKAAAMLIDLAQFPPTVRARMKWQAIFVAGCVLAILAIHGADLIAAGEVPLPIFCPDCSGDWFCEFMNYLRGCGMV